MEETKKEQTATTTASVSFFSPTPFLSAKVRKKRRKDEEACQRNLSVDTTSLSCNPPQKPHKQTEEPLAFSAFFLSFFLYLFLFSYLFLSFSLTSHRHWLRNIIEKRSSLHPFHSPGVILVVVVLFYVFSQVSILHIEEKKRTSEKKETSIDHSFAASSSHSGGLA